MHVPRLTITRYPWGIDMWVETNSPLGNEVGIGNEIELGNGDGIRYNRPYPIDIPNFNYPFRIPTGEDIKYYLCLIKRVTF